MQIPLNDVFCDLRGRGGVCSVLEGWLRGARAADQQLLIDTGLLDYIVDTLLNPRASLFACMFSTWRRMEVLLPC